MCVYYCEGNSPNVSCCCVPLYSPMVLSRGIDFHDPKEAPHSTIEMITSIVTGFFLYLAYIPLITFHHTLFLSPLRGATWLKICQLFKLTIMQVLLPFSIHMCFNDLTKIWLKNIYTFCICDKCKELLFSMLLQTHNCIMTDMKLISNLDMVSFPQVQVFKFLFSLCLIFHSIHLAYFLVLMKNKNITL